jgi:hypothetical protein
MSQITDIIRDIIPERQKAIARNLARCIRAKSLLERNAPVMSGYNNKTKISAPPPFKRSFQSREMMTALKKNFTRNWNRIKKSWLLFFRL